MEDISYSWMEICGLIVAAASMSYAVISWLATRLPVQSSKFAAAVAGPVTILKPLCGVETGTFECLRSFCTQAYPQFQIIFGVSDPDDPALGIVRRLQAEFPQLDLVAVVERRQHGSNRKISNLINMMQHARHDILVLSDSDVKVRPDYLAKVVAPLLEADVGIVTCGYRGVASAGLWSHLGAMYINEWFMPSVRVAALGQSRSFAFGVTIALRRQVLAGIGGFLSMANQLADDYRLGELTRSKGLRTVLSEVEVETHMGESTLADLLSHELRWLRTIRALRPTAYGFLFITFGMPVTAVVALLTGGAPPAMAMLGVAVFARIALHFASVGSDCPALRLVLLPIRDFLGFGLWCWSFTTRYVQWRDDYFQITADGTAEPVARV